MIRAAADGRTRLAIQGGGTKQALGRPAEADAVLSSANLTGITAYRPEELVLSARAGTPFAEISDVLAQNGQRLAFEPIDYRTLLASDGEPTIGAVAAINNSGPRRIAAGAARDSLIGVRFVNGNGEVIRAGGRVMKNVTGLDLVKLLAGSWGTLGFITEVTFKVLPAPETETTLVLRELDDESATRAMAHAMASSTEVSGAAHLPERIAKDLAGGGASTVLRIEGFAESVDDRIERLRALYDDVAGTETIEAAASRDLWRAIGDVAPFAQNHQKPVWRISMTPSEAHAFVMALRMNFAADAYYDWQGGLVWLQLDDGIHDTEIREELARHGAGNAMLVRADEHIRLTATVFQPLPQPVRQVSRRIRDALDPKGIFNPGRMAAD